MSSGEASNAGGSGSGSGGGGGAPCGACKFLRRKCVSECIFAPYFDAEQGAAHFAAVHKIFGASNVSKLLQMIPACKRCEAVVTICYEAQARLKDPVYGCVAHIFALQQQVVNLQAELAFVQAQLASRMAASSNESCSISMSSASYNPSSNYEAAAHLRAQQARSSCSVVKQEPSAFSGGLSGYNPNHHMLLDILGTAGYSGAAGHEGHSSQAALHRSSSSSRSQQQQQLMQHNILHHQHHHHGSDAGVGMGTVGEDLQALAQELLRRNMPMPGASPLSPSSSSP